MSRIHPVSQPKPAAAPTFAALKSSLGKVPNLYATLAHSPVVLNGLLGFADAPLLASAVEGTLFVLESRGVRRGQARGALSRLALGDVRLLGVVLTKFNAKSAKYGGYGYDYAYDYNYGVTTEPRVQS